LALDHYRTINIKQIQTDTLSHFILSRAYTFSLAATGDLTYAMECLESSNIYMSNSQEVKTFIAYFSLVLTALTADIRLCHPSIHEREVFSGRHPSALNSKVTIVILPPPDTRVRCLRRQARQFSPTRPRESGTRPNASDA
jgi:N-acetyltransferase B complex (NatB) non catalytic subunit